MRASELQTKIAQFDLKSELKKEAKGTIGALFIGLLVKLFERVLWSFFRKNGLIDSEDIPDNYSPDNEIR